MFRISVTFEVKAEGMAKEIRADIDLDKFEGVEIKVHPNFDRLAVRPIVAEFAVVRDDLPVPQFGQGLSAEDVRTIAEHVTVRNPNMASAIRKATMRDDKGRFAKDMASPAESDVPDRRIVAMGDSIIGDVL